MVNIIYYLYLFSCFSIHVKARKKNTAGLTYDSCGRLGVHPPRHQHCTCRGHMLSWASSLASALAVGGEEAAGVLLAQHPALAGEGCSLSSPRLASATQCPGQAGLRSCAPPPAHSSSPSMLSVVRMN